jgi:hypothetical protein
LLTEQHAHADALGERPVRGDGAADLVGECRPLAGRGKLTDRQRGVDAADQVIEVEVVCVAAQCL